MSLLRQGMCNDFFLKSDGRESVKPERSVFERPNVSKNILQVTSEFLFDLLVETKFSLAGGP